VIINVTGGPDLSLMEVNDASMLIHGAAHEDANIIFGAVVDPTLDGRVKVTVIATGFDPVESQVAEPAPSQTPVDLQQYTAHLKDKVEAPEVPVLEQPRLSIARRPALDLAGMMQAQVRLASNDDSEAEPGEVDLEALSAFDVPAFLRREG